MKEFQGMVWEYYQTQGRDLPWRQPPFNAYRVLVSEMMLQQTQVVRVIPKYHEFLKRFPDMKSLASASLAGVIEAWSGLGYNRRAKYIHEAAKVLTLQSEPFTLKSLTACKGIGFNTAAAVVTYAYNEPIAFIETNIRTVFIYHFFATTTDIHDKDILELVNRCLTGRGKEHPREWYWALMDYGSYLKKTTENPARQSTQYVKQSRFEGSNRQIRGQILKLLTTGPQSKLLLQTTIRDDRLDAVLTKLQSEHMIVYKHQHYQLAS